MHSGVLLVACALCCAAAAHAARVPHAPAPAPAAHRARRQGVVHRDKCPEGMELDPIDHRLCVIPARILDKIPHIYLEAAKPVRAKRMIGMLPDRAFHYYCPKGLTRLSNGECVSVRASPPRPSDYVEYN